MLLIVNRTMYIVSMRSATSALATCNITPSNAQYHQILHSICTVPPIENIHIVQLYLIYMYQPQCTLCSQVEGTCVSACEVHRPNHLTTKEKSHNYEGSTCMYVLVNSTYTVCTVHSRIHCIYMYVLFTSG